MEPTISKRLARKVREIRIESGVSTEDAAAAVKLTVDEMNAAEAGELAISGPVLARLAKFFGVQVLDFIDMGGDGSWVDRPPPETITAAHGANPEASHRKLIEAKLDEMPYWRMAFPDDLTDPEFDALLVDYLNRTLDALLLMNSFMRGLPEGFVLDEYATHVRLTLRDMWFSAVQLRASVTGDCSNLQSKLLRANRLGNPMNTLKIVFPGDE